MQTAAKSDWTSVEDYLTAEEGSEVRHEYLGGLVYALAGETRAHGIIVLNLAFAIREHLRGKPCEVHAKDIRVNFDMRNDEYFYYPDIVVTCDKRDNHPRWIRFPKLIIEVLSESTERVDRREKFFAYTSIPSLEEYALVGQAQKEVTVFRRGNRWKAERFSGARAKVSLASVKFPLPPGAIYEGV
ncbi:MAG TPA: Uma2 family endonuclease [Verrucomicrobiae bacterium]|nr:Uma2 family endonuclease [Verrucomicrobiae bacterium]